MDWFLYDKDLGHKRVKFEHTCIAQPMCLGITADSKKDSNAVYVVQYFSNWNRIHRKNYNKNMQDCPLLPIFEAHVIDS